MRLEIVLSIVVVAALSISFNRCDDLCGHRWGDNNDFYSRLTDDIQPINIRSNNCQADLLVKQANGRLVMVTSKPTGLFNDEMEINILQGDFCNTGTDKIYVADMDGDHYDDLLCRKQDGSFTVRYYKSKRFTPAEQFAKDFLCGTSANNVEILIGDFDGNHASDIICYSTTASNLDSSSIYFSQVNCFLHHRHHHHHDQRYARHTDWLSMRGCKRFHNDHTTLNCEKGLPMISALPSNSLSSCLLANSAIYMTLDANGDGRDDIACFDNTGKVFTYLSSGLRTGSLFSTTSIDIDSCSFSARTILPIDIDGDGDDDLACADKNVDTTNRLIIQTFSSGTYPTSFPNLAAPQPPPWDPFCSATGLGGTIPATYHVADFNGDGKEDLMCRYNDGNQMKTQVVYSESCL